MKATSLGLPQALDNFGFKIGDERFQVVTIEPNDLRPQRGFVVLDIETGTFIHTIKGFTEEAEAAKIAAQYNAEDPEVAELRLKLMALRQQAAEINEQVRLAILEFQAAAVSLSPFKMGQVVHATSWTVRKGSNRFMISSISVDYHQQLVYYGRNLLKSGRWSAKQHRLQNVTFIEEN